MLNNAKIGIIGGDMRQNALVRHLSEYGFEVAAWGLTDGKIGEAVRCLHWKSAVEKSSAVILPLPAFPNGKYIIEPQCGGESVTLSQILYAMPKGAVLLGGKIDKVVRNSAENHKISVFDYFENEMLQIKNAVPTAEGAIEIALRELPITLNGAGVLVCGYGRIGKALARLLKSFGAKVYVSARSDEDIAYIETSGYRAVRYTDNTFTETVSTVDAVFNTVPVQIIDKTVVGKMLRCKLIIDLASGEGGVDFDAASRNGIKSIHALALPGKTAPITAGEILAECILDMLLKQGVRPE